MAIMEAWLTLQRHQQFRLPQKYLPFLNIYLQIAWHNLHSNWDSLSAILKLAEVDCSEVAHSEHLVLSYLWVFLVWMAVEDIEIADPFVFLRHEFLLIK